MELAAGILLAVIAAIGWGGQTIAWFAPDTAVRWSLMEAEKDVEPVYWGDIRGEALWDTLTLWTLLAAGALLAVGAESWPYLGLVGGAMYVYFAGRGIATRVAIRRRGFRIGSDASLRVAYVALGVWGVVGLATVVAATLALAG